MRSVFLVLPAVATLVLGAARAILLIGLSLLSVGAINGADDLRFAGVALNSAETAAAGPLTLAERVAYQYAIEEVYWRHRIWPKERHDLKPSLDEVMSTAQIERNVENYLRNSSALEQYCHSRAHR